MNNYIIFTSSFNITTNSLTGKSGSIIQDDGNSAGTIASRATVISAKTLRKRRIASIFQHYYPEGGWGYVILLCAFLVQILTHGLQLSFGMFLPIIFHRFRIANPVEIGKKNISYVLIY